LRLRAELPLNFLKAAEGRHAVLILKQVAHWHAAVLRTLPRFSAISAKDRVKLDRRHLDFRTIQAFSKDLGMPLS
jgi:hypothetical protein